ncbi:hypothetical protein A3731_00735 [Roseovarius sp. HI0049]|nr:hypothetical protein A3731_00735 [Roseovarius sp. HI0049]
MMTETRETLEADLVALRRARASGAREVEFDGGRNGTRRRVQYRSDSELASAIADVERRLAALTRQPVKVTYVTATKGV